jgi:hypothetical protein
VIKHQDCQAPSIYFSKSGFEVGGCTTESHSDVIAYAEVTTRTHRRRESIEEIFAELHIADPF